MISTSSSREQSERIGFVQQSPENQIVTDKVWHELAFGLESLGFDTSTIRRRVPKWQVFLAYRPGFIKTSLSSLADRSNYLTLRP